MSSTDKVLGTIGALQTLVDNFPMSILDLLKGKTYTSIFDFLIDVLVACGVDINEAVEWLLEKIYSVEVKLDNLQDVLGRMNVKDTQECTTLKIIEYGVKGILMSLLSSIYGCSSVPVLPNKYMDYPNPDIFDKEGKGRLKLWETSQYPFLFDIPVKMIDPMGMLEITPTSTEGRIFYDIEGIDVYYKKTEVPISFKSTYTTKSITNIVALLETNNNETWLSFISNNKLPENIKINIEYLDKQGNNLTWETVIKIASNKSENRLLIANDNCKISQINSIRINDNLGSYEIAGGIICYLTKNIDEAYDELFTNVIWGNTPILGVSSHSTELDYNEEAEEEYMFPDDDYDIYADESENKKHYKYEQLSETPKKFRKAKRMYSVPSNVNENSPDLIVVYMGPKLNELYKTFDMNAFLWYVINKSASHTQREINYTMWDSRLLMKKHINLLDYNKWYASKDSITSEFLNITSGNTQISKSDILYPILQLKKSPTNLYGINISFPSQRYYKPVYREKQINDEESNFNLNFNSSIYRFNWDYLKSINIFKPKIMLAGFVNYLTGGVLYNLSSTDINITKKLIKTKLSTAVKKIIEADDMEIEDCYTMFSNDEFNSMLEDMLLSRYNKTYYGGNTNKVKTHDAETYYSMIDSLNLNTSRSESVSKLTKLVDDIIETPGEEGSLDFGFESNVDKNILFKELLWAITMPIIESLFTPQVMLLLIINMHLTGLVNINNFSVNDLGLILNLILNKIMGLLKSIIEYIKDLIVELLYEFLMKKIVPLILKWMAALNLEKLNNWLTILTASLNCIPLFKFNINKENNIDDVNYADIVSRSIPATPEASSC